MARRHGHAWRAQASRAASVSQSADGATPRVSPAYHERWWALLGVCPVSLLPVHLPLPARTGTARSILVARPTAHPQQGISRGRDPYASRVLRDAPTPGRLTGVSLRAGQTLDVLSDHLTGAAPSAPPLP